MNIDVVFSMLQLAAMIGVPAIGFTMHRWHKNGEIRFREIADELRRCQRQHRKCKRLLRSLQLRYDNA